LFVAFFLTIDTQVLAPNLLEENGECFDWIWWNNENKENLQLRKWIRGCNIRQTDSSFKII